MHGGCGSDTSMHGGIMNKNTHFITDQIDTRLAWVNEQSGGPNATPAAYQPQASQDRNTPSAGSDELTHLLTTIKDFLATGVYNDKTLESARALVPAIISDRANVLDTQRALATITALHKVEDSTVWDADGPIPTELKLVLKSVKAALEQAEVICKLSVQLASSPPAARVLILRDALRGADRDAAASIKLLANAPTEGSIKQLANGPLETYEKNKSGSDQPGYNPGRDATKPQEEDDNVLYDDGNTNVFGNTTADQDNVAIKQEKKSRWDFDDKDSGNVVAQIGNTAVVDPIVTAEAAKAAAIARRLTVDRDIVALYEGAMVNNRSLLDQVKKSYTACELAVGSERNDLAALHTDAEKATHREGVRSRILVALKQAR